MEKENKLKVSDYLIACTDFEKDPENEGNYQKIQNFLSDLVIREYIPLKEKEIITINVLETINKDYDAPGAAAFIEMGKVTRALLSYCVNLDNDITILSFGYYATDLIYKHGLFDTVTKVCGADYNRLTTMIDNAINASNIYRLAQTAELFDQESYDKWLKTMNELKDTMDSQSIKDLITLVNEDNEGNNSLINQLKEMAIDQVNTEMREEELKFKKAAGLITNEEESEESDDGE